MKNKYKIPYRQSLKRKIQNSLTNEEKAGIKNEQIDNVIRYPNGYIFEFKKNCIIDPSGNANNIVQSRVLKKIQEEIQEAIKNKSWFISFGYADNQMDFYTKDLDAFLFSLGYRPTGFIEGDKIETENENDDCGFGPTYNSFLVGSDFIRECSEENPYGYYTHTFLIRIF